MPTPLLTIGIPCRNGEKTLPLTLQSIFAQTFQDWELIIVNDGSTDGTAAILDSLDDPRVRVVHHAQSAGQGVRANEIADLARCEYLARMDADDVMFPDRLARQLEFARSDPDANLVGGAVVIIDKDDGVRGRRVGMITEYKKIGPYTTKDGFLVRELMHPKLHGNSRQSLAQKRPSQRGLKRSCTGFLSRQVLFWGYLHGGK